MTTKNDCELVKAYIGGIEDALKVLLERHQSRVYNYIYNKVNNPELVEDLFQEVFIKVIVTLKNGKYNEEGKFLAWVLRIAHNLIVDYFRASNKTVVVSEYSGTDCEYSIFDHIKSVDASIEELLIKEQVCLELREIIELLPKEQKEVLELRYFKDLSFKEISEEKNISINTALGRMRYALINLRKLIESKNVVLI